MITFLMNLYFLLVQCLGLLKISIFLLQDFCQLTRPKTKFLNEVKNFYWDDLYLFKYCLDQIFRRCISDNEVSSVIKALSFWGMWESFLVKKTTPKILQYGFYWPTMFKDIHAFCKTCENFQKLGFISKHKGSLDNLLLTLETYLGEDVHRVIHDL